MDGRALTTSAARILDLGRHDLRPGVDAAVEILDDAKAIDQLNRLVTKLAGQQAEIERFDRYYRGSQPLSFLHPEIALHLGDRLRSMVINWPRLVLDSLEERLDIQGFRLGAGEPDREIWKIWQANDFDLASGRVHLSAMRHGRAFVSVWYGPGEGEPRMAAETARQVAVECYPGTSIVRAAVKQWQDGPIRYANLYLPDRIVKYQRAGTTARSRARSTTWDQRAEPVENPLGVVPIVPFLNRYDLDLPDGESELADVIHLADAINKLATDMMVASEFHAMPRRWATGIDIPKSNPNSTERRRLEEEARAYWARTTAGNVWLAGKDVTFGQFASAELENFVRAIGMLTAKVAALAGLPPHYVGINGDNPASADAIRSAEASLIKRAERKQRTWSEPWEDVVALALTIRGAGAPDDVAELETIWRDPQTPTVAQKSDAAVKLHTAGLIDAEQAQEDLGYTPLQRERIRNRQLATLLAFAAADPQTATRVRDALALVDEDGVDPKVAFAAVGLLLPPKAVQPGPKAPEVPAGDPAVA
jgi:Phage portal protein, SPP1 Gp6-like